jgi:membrane protein YqaA with SNARE-associated domain
MIRNLYDWTLRMAGSRHALPSLFAVSFAESSFFPIPPDIMMVPMVLARRDLAWKIAAVCTVGSVLGGIFGYAIGYYLYDTLGAWLIHLYGLEGKAEQFHQRYAKWGAALILAKGLTPIPFKLVTIVSGLAKFNFGLFVLTAAITRALRFFLIAALLRQFGEPIQAFIEKRLTLVLMTFLAAIVGGFALIAALG